MEAHTHREYQAAIAWLNMEMNRPTVSQHYMMQISQRVQQAKAKSPNKISLKNQILSFVTGKKQTKKVVSKDDQIKQSKSRWFAGLGIKGKK